MNKKARKDMLEKIDLYALIGILVGVVLLGQPFSKVLFVIGFPLILVSIALHNVIDHLV
jgi:hypothetical protein